MAIIITADKIEEKSVKLIKAEQRVAKWKLALEQCMSHDLSKKSYLTKEAKKYYDKYRDGDFNQFAISRAEQFIEWIEKWELKYALENLKVRQEIEERAKAKTDKEKAEQAKIDALPECVKVFMKEVEEKTIEATLKAEIGKEKAVDQIRKEDPEQWKKLPWNVRFFVARDRDEITKDVKKDVRWLALDFIARVDEKVGKVTDTSMLRTAPSKYGTVINGFVKGEKGSTEIETIWAGGYNIQRLHCRVLVK